MIVSPIFISCLYEVERGMQILGCACVKEGVRAVCASVVLVKTERAELWRSGLASDLQIPKKRK